MATQLLNLPVNIPWKQIAVSPDMMDTKFANKRFPFLWRSSLAISVFEPKLEDLPEELCKERITYIKVTCTITGYQPDETREAISFFPNVPTEQIERIIGDYFACYGVLLNVAVFPVRVFLPDQPPLPGVDLDEYPHIVAFEPKIRDFYQSATETGEILTASNSKVATDKSLIHTEQSETGVSVTAGYGPGGAATRAAGSITGSLTHKWGETEQDSTSLQTDASRERRETQGTTTQLSQMYNLLTGYHQGTNRAVFLMLPRPHVLQPTDHLTFVQGLRYIEGIQEFMLVVTRQRSITGMCVEAFLETGHFPDSLKLTEPDADYDEGHEDFIVSAESQEDEAESIETFLSSKYIIETGWVIDRREKRKGRLGNKQADGWDPGHPGIKDLDAKPGELNSEGSLLVKTPIGKVPSVNIYNYQPISDNAVQVFGRVLRRALKADETQHFRRRFRVFTRREQPKPINSAPAVPLNQLIIVSRGIYVCFRSGEECPEVVQVRLAPDAPGVFRESIVDERTIKVNSALLTREAQHESRLPAMKELLRQIQSAMTTSWRLPSRYPAGQIGFLESDYFKNRIKAALPKERLDVPLGKISGLPEQVVKSLGEKSTVGEALEMDLPGFARKTGLSIEESAKARRILLGFTPAAGEYAS